MCHYCTQNLGKDCGTKEWSLDATISTKCRKHLACKIARRLVNLFLDIGFRSFSILSASDLAWAATSLQMAFVCVEKPGGGGAALSSSSDRNDTCNRLWKQIKTGIKELKQFVFQSSEQVRSWLGPVKDAGRPGGWDWKERHLRTI